MTGRQPGSKNYTKEFREAVAAEANDPNRSIAEVARAHGLNANMVAQWRRSLLDTQPAPSLLRSFECRLLLYLHSGAR
ncbi:transposase [Burkholderia vietnamiensis]|uniref:transposase n=2 Tax=Burkholderiaceae TaxID=119060 RepID=UPI001BA9AB42|nr:transposase [Burkholderia vietnamiensis]MCA8395118.1 transposase [Burkholderia vietnamiensis]